MKDEKPRIGRPPKFEGGSEPVSVRLSSKDIQKLAKAFGTVGEGVQKAVEEFIKALGVAGPKALNKGKKK